MKVIVRALMFVAPSSATFADMGGVMSKVVPSDSATGGKADGKFYHLKYPALGGTHFGVDIWDHKGSKVYPIACGIVLSNKSNSVLGNVVHLKHTGIGKNGRDLYTLNLHLNSIAGHVTEGTTVCPDKPIGTIGGTGSSTGNIAHLHFEVRYFSELYHPNALCNGRPNIYACGDVRNEVWAQNDWEDPETFTVQQLKPEDICVHPPCNISLQTFSTGEIVGWYPLSGLQCTQWLETADPHRWSDNYLCY